jgi:hypothetical protein
MASIPTKSELPDPIRDLLGQLRNIIRRFVVVQTVVLLGIVALIGFWITGLIDYFPVMMGASESPRWARLMMLVALVGGLAVIVYRFGFRKFFVPWRDSTLALLLERRFPQFNHSLITTVQAAQPSRSSTFELLRHEDLLAETEKQAIDQIGLVDPDEVMRWEPLRLQLGLLGGLIGLSFLLVLWQPAWTFHWGKRLFGLSNGPWPRLCRVEVDGIEIDIPNFNGEEQGRRYLRPFSNGTVSLPRGHSGRLLVHADLRAEQIPDACTLSYRSHDGRQGRATLRRLNAVDNFKLPFMLEGPPLESIDQGLAMTLQAGDARIAGLRLEVVDAPQVNDLKLDIRYPSYLGRNPTSTWIDEIVDYRTGLRIPQGSEIVLVGKASLPLRKCEAKITFSSRDGETISQAVTASGHGPTFQLPIGSIQSNILIELRLWDESGHSSTKIQQYFLNVLVDEIPSIDLKLDGIGSAVTENALLPLLAEVSDDNGLANTWIELYVNESESWTRDVAQPTGGKLTEQVDLRALRDAKELQVKPGQSIGLTMLAQDYFDLNEGERIGRASPIQLGVVTPNQLLVLLERRELAMRSRLELIISELTQLQELMLKVRQSNRDGTDAALQLPRVQQSVIQVEKSAGELLGVETEIGQIYRELINNRIDSQDRQDRLENRIRVPLSKIREGSLNELTQRAIGLEKEIEKGQIADEKIGATLESLSETLLGLEAILGALIDIQDFNEVVDMVRSMVDDQSKLIDRTKAEQKQRLLDQFK